MSETLATKLSAATSNASEKFELVTSQNSTKSNNSSKQQNMGDEKGKRISLGEAIKNMSWDGVHCDHDCTDCTKFAQSSTSAKPTEDRFSTSNNLDFYLIHWINSIEDGLITSTTMHNNTSAALLLHVEWVSILNTQVVQEICQHAVKGAGPKVVMESFTVDESLTGRENAYNFIEFLKLLSKLSGEACPYNENPFQVTLSKTYTTNPTMQELLFSNASTAKCILLFLHKFDGATKDIPSYFSYTKQPLYLQAGHASDELETLNKHWLLLSQLQKYHTPPAVRPSPFEISVWAESSTLVHILSFLSDPSAVCKMKQVNTFCNRTISQNEHRIMKQAVRGGGMSNKMRTKFWIWITTKKSHNRKWRIPTHFEQNMKRLSLTGGTKYTPRKKSSSNIRIRNFAEMERLGEKSEWAYLIERDVRRSFGDLPPHKQRSRNHADSIIRFLVAWGRNKIRRTHKRVAKMSACIFIPTRRLRRCNSDSNITHVDTVLSDCDDGGYASDCGYVSLSPVNGHYAFTPRSAVEQQASSDEEDLALALSGNKLSEEAKLYLQTKLRSILHALAETFPEIGYCQGMDYIVVHLLRVLCGDDTSFWQPGATEKVFKVQQEVVTEDDKGGLMKKFIDEELPLEEIVYRMTDTLFTVYNIRHMYMPMLRCLKRSCRIFERLLKKKLPVLADHFEHHDLKIGCFSLGWFQTMFLYLPSMPSATVSHMWDIWFVERSFKIFYRVGIAILSLSQPILLNHELEGMMIYLNTFPDSTLLNPDILIACALQIKVTNTMLMEIEKEVAQDEENM